MTSIEKLTKILESQVEERERYQKADDLKHERQKTIDSAPTPWKTELWCKGCNKDFIRMAHKVVINFYSRPIAFYEVKCPDNKHWCRRRITDKANDPYYSESEHLRKLKKEMEIDLLQPDDPRFKKYWGDPNEKFNKKKDADERAEWEKKKTM